MLDAEPRGLRAWWNRRKMRRFLRKKFAEGELKFVACIGLHPPKGAERDIKKFAGEK